MTVAGAGFGTISARGWDRDARRDPLRGLRSGLRSVCVRRAAEEKSVLKIFDLSTCPTAPMENGRGETIRLINTGIGTEKIDLHLNRLSPGGPRGRVHRHSQSDNVYIVR